MEAKPLTLMKSDNHIRGHQIRIVAFLNTFSTGTLTFHKPGKHFLSYVTFVHIPDTSFALLPRSKKWKERQEKRVFSTVPPCPLSPWELFVQWTEWTSVNRQIRTVQWIRVQPTDHAADTSTAAQVLTTATACQFLHSENTGRKSSDRRKQQYPVSALPASVKSILRVHRKW